jgi:hypothetical protein
MATVKTTHSTGYNTDKKLLLHALSGSNYADINVAGDATDLDIIITPKGAGAVRIYGLEIPEVSSGQISDVIIDQGNRIEVLEHTALIAISADLQLMDLLQARADIVSLSGEINDIQAELAVVETEYARLDGADFTGHVTFAEGISATANENYIRMRVQFLNQLPSASGYEGCTFAVEETGKFYYAMSNEWHAFLSEDTYQHITLTNELISHTHDARLPAMVAMELLNGELESITGFTSLSCLPGYGGPGDHNHMIEWTVLGDGRIYPRIHDVSGGSDTWPNHLITPHHITKTRSVVEILAEEMQNNLNSQNAFQRVTLLENTSGNHRHYAEISVEDALYLFRHQKESITVETLRYSQSESNYLDYDHLDTAEAFYNDRGHLHQVTWRYDAGEEGIMRNEHLGHFSISGGRDNELHRLDQYFQFGRITPYSVSDRILPEVGGDYDQGQWGAYDTIEVFGLSGSNHTHEMEYKENGMATLYTATEMMKYDKTGGIIHGRVGIRDGYTYLDAQQLDSGAMEMLIGQNSTDKNTTLSLSAAPYWQRFDNTAIKVGDRYVAIMADEYNNPADHDPSHLGRVVGIGNHFSKTNPPTGDLHIWREHNTTVKTYSGQNTYLDTTVGVASSNGISGSYGGAGNLYKTTLVQDALSDVQTIGTNAVYSTDVNGLRVSTEDIAGTDTSTLTVGGNKTTNKIVNSSEFINISASVNRTTTETIGNSGTGSEVNIKTIANSLTNTLTVGVAGGTGSITETTTVKNNQTVTLSVGDNRIVTETIGSDNTGTDTTTLSVANSKTDTVYVGMQSGSGSLTENSYIRNNDIETLNVGNSRTRTEQIGISGGGNDTYTLSISGNRVTTETVLGTETTDLTVTSSKSDTISVGAGSSGNWNETVNISGTANRTHLAKLGDYKLRLGALGDAIISLSGDNGSSETTKDPIIQLFAEGSAVIGQFSITNDGLAGGTAGISEALTNAILVGSQTGHPVQVFSEGHARITVLPGTAASDKNNGGFVSAPDTEIGGHGTPGATIGNVGIGTTAPLQRLHVVGNALIDGSLVINEDLIVLGDVVQMNTQTVTVEDNIIALNHLSGGAITGNPAITTGTMTSGLTIDRVALPQYNVLFYEVDDTFRVGAAGTEKRVLTHDETLIQGAYIFYGTGAANTSSSINTSTQSTHNGGVATPAAFVYTEGTGNLGIGMTDPTYNIDVQDTGAGFRFTDKSPTQSNFSSTNYELIGQWNAGTFYMGTKYSNSFTLQTENKDRLTIDTAGKLVINTADVSEASIGNYTVPTIFATPDASGGDLVFDSSTAGGHRFYIAHNATPAVHINSSANVGIGVANPSHKLNVAGNVVPSVNSTYDLGTTVMGWNNLYASGFIFPNATFNFSRNGSSVAFQIGQYGQVGVGGPVVSTDMIAIAPGGSATKGIGIYGTTNGMSIGSFDNKGLSVSSSAAGSTGIEVSSVSTGLQVTSTTGTAIIASAPTAGAYAGSFAGRMNITGKTTIGAVLASDPSNTSLIINDPTNWSTIRLCGATGTAGQPFVDLRNTNDGILLLDTSNAIGTPVIDYGGHKGVYLGAATVGTDAANLQNVWDTVASTVVNIAAQHATTYWRATNVTLPATGALPWDGLKGNYLLTVSPGTVYVGGAVGLSGYAVISGGAHFIPEYFVYNSIGKWTCRDLLVFANGIKLVEQVDYTIDAPGSIGGHPTWSNSITTLGSYADNTESFEWEIISFETKDTIRSDGGVMWGQLSVLPAPTDPTHVVRLADLTWANIAGAPTVPTNYLDTTTGGTVGGTIRVSTGNIGIGASSVVPMYSGVGLRTVDIYATGSIVLGNAAGNTAYITLDNAGGAISTTGTLTVGANASFANLVAIGTTSLLDVAGDLQLFGGNALNMNSKPIHNLASASGANDGVNYATMQAFDANKMSNMYVVGKGRVDMALAVSDTFVEQAIAFTGTGDIEKLIFQGTITYPDAAYTPTTRIMALSFTDIVVGTLGVANGTASARLDFAVAQTIPTNKVVVDYIVWARND